jgi:hypothetical protein
VAAAQARVTHRALDGRRFLLSGQIDLRLPFTSVVDMTVRGRLHEFTAGSARLGEDIARALGVAGFDEELSYQGGTLLIGRTRPYDWQTHLVEDMLVAVWRGRRYCLVTQMYGMPTADVLGVLRTMRIEQHDDGVMLRPDRSGGSDFAAPATVVKEVPELGLLEMSPLTDQHVRALPAWRGMSTPAGELFQDRLSDGKPYFILAAADTWTTVLPLATTVHDQVPKLVGRLRVQTVA